MIQDVEETLRRFLGAEFGSIPACPIKKLEQITFEHPSLAEDPQLATTRVNLFLYDVRENSTLRESAFHQTGRPGDLERGVRRPPVQLDLSYLITTSSQSSTAQEHQLLTEVLGAFLRNPVIPSSSFLGEYLGQPSGTIISQIAQTESLGKRDLMLLWQAIGGRLRASLPLVITVKYDPFESRLTKIVRELVLDFQTGVSSGDSLASNETKRIRITLAGMVVNQETEEPIEGANLRIDGSERSAVTDANGFFYFLNLPVGIYTLNANKEGYILQETAAEACNAEGGIPDPIVISLHPQAANIEISKRIGNRTSQKKTLRNEPSPIVAKLEPQSDVAKRKSDATE